jgi:hypothetical protein
MTMIPGPYRFCDDTDIGSNGEPVRSVWVDSPAAQSGVADKPCDLSAEEWVGTARAIAALPHLIDALRLFVGENATHTDTERIAAARDALALLEDPSRG